MRTIRRPAVHREHLTKESDISMRAYSPFSSLLSYRQRRPSPSPSLSLMPCKCYSSPILSALLRFEQLALLSSFVAPFRRRSDASLQSFVSCPNLAEFRNIYSFVLVRRSIPSAYNRCPLFYLSTVNVIFRKKLFLRHR